MMRLRLSLCDWDDYLADRATKQPILFEAVCRLGRRHGKPHLGAVSRDNLDENGRRQSELEAAAGSEVMIDLGR
jgi:hypothetical protein